jgi:peptidoglycan/xylan/chitin deacetylase (PgdA/CDA1 family)
MCKKSILFLLLLISLSTIGFGLEDEIDITEAIENRGQIPVLMYHHILPENQRSTLPYNAAIISFESFKEQMSWLYHSGWTALSLEDFHSALMSDRPLPEKSFVITFDDGYASNLFFSFPTLNRYNFPAAEFIITANLEEETRKWDGKKLSWEDAKAISSIFSIHSHSHTFHQLQDGKPMLTVKTQEEIQEDLDFAWAEIDRHIEPGFRAFAYPYGVASEAAIDVLKNQDVQLAFTTKTGYVTEESDPLLLPRFSITPSVSMEDFQSIFQPKPIEEPIAVSRPDDQNTKKSEEDSEIPSTDKDDLEDKR